MSSYLRLKKDKNSATMSYVKNRVEMWTFDYELPRDEKEMTKTFLDAIINLNKVTEDLEVIETVEKVYESHDLLACPVYKKKRTVKVVKQTPPVLVTKKKLIVNKVLDFIVMIVNRFRRKGYAKRHNENVK